MSRLKPTVAREKADTISVVPTAPQSPWSGTHGMYIAGRAYIDEADATAAEMEAKWGAGRLRLLVGPELREKFDRQRYLFNQATWHGDLEAVRTQSARMVKGWLALDRAATAAGKEPRAIDVWEVTLDSGVVAAIVPDIGHAKAVQAEGRKVAVFTLDEIARLLSASHVVASAKVVFPGATVVRVGRDVDDPLDGIRDTSGDLDDEMPF